MAIDPNRPGGSVNRPYLRSLCERRKIMRRS
jgi:hypothetical protein